ncbi:hypothetical protein AVEN_167973-1 [Araneus ventricosus]|uniref:Uncharacterized protein n=1 Tax=Araneus ventricosus TaxID=182803 RepID=A0A4Y2SPH7_ARAVE|nr:hypothetical protein AVEN_167973-1 [Araneus ventricosus]
MTNMFRYDFGRTSNERKAHILNPVNTSEIFITRKSSNLPSSAEMSRYDKKGRKAKGRKEISDERSHHPTTHIPLDADIFPRWMLEMNSFSTFYNILCLALSETKENRVRILDLFPLTYWTQHLIPIDKFEAKTT